jgi:uncharacterized membrane protein
MMADRNRRYVFRPFSFMYLGVLIFLFIVMVPVFMSIYRRLLVQGVGLPPESFGAVLFGSLVGSFINLPLTTVETKVPVYTFREVKFFWVTWRMPEVEMGVRKTHILINVGGAIVPILISGYLVLYSIPAHSTNLSLSYIRLAAVLLFVTFMTHRSSRIVKGLGIATPMFGPPITTALATIVVDAISPMTCPTQIAYVGGTLGALIGADLLNLHKLPEIGAPVASIGGAGTFDGIFLTGLMSVLFVLLLL